MTEDGPWTHTLTVTLLDLLVESYNLLFEWRGRVGSVHMKDVYLDSALRRLS